MRIAAILVLLVSLIPHTWAQLLPSIGLPALPADSDSVCYMPFYTGSFSASGLQEGDTASDFTLYDLNGNDFNLSQKLSSRPVLLVAGSYTCPVFRNKVAAINNIYTLYGGQIEVAIIYTPEAHPDIDTSVYFGYVNTGAANIAAGILYRQPVTYGERKDVVSDMLGAMNILAPVYIDGPCNNWWSHYGPAPNNAYLIDTNGIVFAKHGWFDKYPDNMICDIDSLLGNPVTCTGNGVTGYFTFNLLTNDTIIGPAGSTLTFSGELVNNSNNDVIVDIYRLINDMPPGWASSLCADVCYPTSTDTASIYITAGSVQDFHFYIYSGNSTDTAKARIGFRNAGVPSNQTARNLTGITIPATGHQELPEGHRSPWLFPNPSNGTLFLFTAPFSSSSFKINILDYAGRLIWEHRLPNTGDAIQIPIPVLDPGLYLFQVQPSVNEQRIQRLVIYR